MTEITLRPTADGYISEMWYGYANVSDDSDSTFIYKTNSTGWVRSAFSTLMSIPHNVTISKVEVKYRWRRAVSYNNPVNCKAFIRLGGTNYDAPQRTTSSASFVDQTETWAQNPATLTTWDRSDLNSMEFGVYGSPNHTKGGIYISEIYLIVTFFESAPFESAPMGGGAIMF